MVDRINIYRKLVAILPFFEKPRTTKKKNKVDRVVETYKTIETVRGAGGVYFDVETVRGGATVNVDTSRPTFYLY